MIDDDTTWAESDSFTDNIIDSLFVFGDFIYAGTSQDGKIFRSSDGTTWTEVDVSDHQNIKVMPYKELAIVGIVIGISLYCLINWLFL